MSIYVEAYNKDGRQILGNLDGQFVFLRIRNYKRTYFYRLLRNGHFKRATVFKIVTETGTCLEQFDNPGFNGKET